MTRPLASRVYPRCDPRRFNTGGVLKCPHGCVTECAKERLARIVDKAEARGVS